MPTQFDPPPDWKLPEVDLSKRYDLYCAEPGSRVVVYRNARFKSATNLPGSSIRGGWTQFVEVEQANGQSVHLSRQSMLKFCEHGVEVCPEILTPNEQKVR